MKKNNQPQLSKIYPSYPFQPLFDHMLNEHGLKLLESEMTDIIILSDMLIGKDLDEKKQQALALGLNVNNSIAWLTDQYERLYDQLKAEPERRIACWVNYKIWGRISDPQEFYRDICSIRGKQMEFTSRGHCYGGGELWLYKEDHKEYFLIECERLQVQWLDEKGGAI